MPKEGERKAIPKLSDLTLDTNALMQLKSANAVLANILETAKSQGFSLEDLLNALSMNSYQEVSSITPSDIWTCLSTNAPPTYKVAIILELGLEIPPAFSRHYTQPDPNGSGPGEQPSYQQ